MKAPKSSLYDLTADPGESRDLAAAQPRPMKSWDGKLVAFLNALGEKLDTPVRPENVLSAEQRRQLASLGYLGGVAEGPVTGSLPDPRAMAGVARDLHAATQTVQEGHCDQALPRLQAIVKQDPHNFPALSLAGFCLRQAGRTESALSLFQRAEKENDINAVPIADAAGCLLDLGPQGRGRAGVPPRPHPRSRAGRGGEQPGPHAAPARRPPGSAGGARDRPQGRRPRARGLPGARGRPRRVRQSRRRPHRFPRGGAARPRQPRAAWRTRPAPPTT